MNFLEVLEWRYATKQFDPTKQLSQEQLDTVLRALSLSPSSYGLQPWKYIVVSNPEIRAQLKEAAYGQPQITDASHLIVLCAKRDMTVEYVDMYMQRIAEVRGVPVAELSGFKSTITSFLESMDDAARLEWMKRQVYIALGMGLAACATQQVDACPMEGFNSAEFDRILNTEALGVTATVLMPVGFRSEQDATAQEKKVRFDQKDVAVFV